MYIAKCYYQIPEDGSYGHQMRHVKRRLGSGEIVNVVSGVHRIDHKVDSHGSALQINAPPHCGVPLDRKENVCIGSRALEIVGCEKRPLAFGRGMAHRTF